MKKILLLVTMIFIGSSFNAQETQNSTNSKPQFTSTRTKTTITNTGVPKKNTIIYPGCENLPEGQSMQICLKDKFTEDLESTLNEMGYDLGCKHITTSLKVGNSKSNENDFIITVVSGSLSDEQKNDLQKVLQNIEDKYSSNEKRIKFSTEDDYSYNYKKQFTYMVIGVPDYILDTFELNGVTYNAIDVCDQIIFKEQKQLVILERFPTEDDYYAYKDSFMSQAENTKKKSKKKRVRKSASDSMKDTTTDTPVETSDELNVTSSSDSNLDTSNLNEQ